MCDDGKNVNRAWCTLYVFNMLDAMRDLKGLFRILDIGPNFQVSQCVIYHWRPFNTFH